MNQKDKKEIIQIACEAIEKVMMPVLDDILKNQDEMKKELETKPSKEEVDERFDEADERMDRIERKLDATITVVDKDDVLMKK